MPAQLIRYTRYPGSIEAPSISLLKNAEDLLPKLFFLIRNQTGRDFSMYKKNTIYRRIERRMQLHQIADMADYVAFLQKNDLEVATLARELLIGVTGFFRDPDAYDVLLHRIFTPFLDQKPNDYTLRVWVSRMQHR